MTRIMATVASASLKQCSRRDTHDALHAPAFAAAPPPRRALRRTRRRASSSPPPRHHKGACSRQPDLGLLESPDRAAWQKPDLIMDALKIAYGDTVADIGAGSGFFTVRLARRVDPRGENGLVYAEDIQPQMIESIKRRVSREGLKNVVTRLGTATDTNLPKGGIDAVLVVDVYQEIEDEASRIRLLRHLADTLKPKGRIGIVNYKPGGGGPGPEPQRRLDRAVVEAEVRAAGLRVLDGATLPFQYLLIVGR